jgi:predicted Zn-dependent protease with MMP-like domain
MQHLNDEEFAAIISEAMDNLPERFASRMDNVAVVYEDDPSPVQRKELALRGNQTLFGLYQGIPLPQRGIAYNMVLPDKITIFKNPLLAASQNEADLRDKVRHTLWHEVAHHFGLGHDRIHELDEKRQIERRA